MNCMQIKESYMVVFVDATTLDRKPYRGWRREKYIGMEGLLLIVADNETRHIQWHPIDKGKILYNKGIVSSNDDITIENNDIVVKTQNSYYYFSRIKTDIEEAEITKLKLW